METMMKQQKKPKVKLVGADGNAFMVIGLCKQAAERAGWTKEQISEVVREMSAGDYSHLLMVAMERFDVR